MSSFTYPCGSAPISELPSILKARFEGYVVNILEEEDLKKILPLCKNKRYSIVIDDEINNKEEHVVGYSVTVNEYSEVPEIVRITRICTC